jgi:hypothetical protein
VVPLKIIDGDIARLACWSAASPASSNCVKHAPNSEEMTKVNPFRRQSTDLPALPRGPKQTMSPMPAAKVAAMIANIAATLLPRSIGTKISSANTEPTRLIAHVADRAELRMPVGNSSAT